MNKRRSRRARLKLLRFTFFFSLTALILSLCALFVVSHGRARYTPVSDRDNLLVTGQSASASLGNTGSAPETIQAPQALTPSVQDVPLQTEDVAVSDAAQQVADLSNLPEKLLQSRDTAGLTDEKIASLMAENRGLYYFDRLSEAEQRLYAELLHIMQSLSSDVYLAQTDADVIEKVQNCVMNDHPEIFYITGYYSTRYTIGDETVGFAFTGRSSYDAAEIANRNAQIEQYIANCLAGVNAGWDDYGKVRYIYDYLVAHTSYNLSAPDNQNICSVMLGHESVCQGYAKSAQLLLNRLGIPATLVIGEANSATLSGPHAWNVVYADGNWYHLDVTWGDASFRDENEESEGINYDYLLTTTADIAATHTISTVVEMPYCDSMQDNYYVREGAYFTEASLQAFADLSARRYDAGENCVRFKCATQDVYNAMMMQLIDEKHIFDYIYKAPGESLLFTRSDAQRSFTVWF